MGAGHGASPPAGPDGLDATVMNAERFELSPGRWHCLWHASAQPRRGELLFTVNRDRFSVANYGHRCVEAELTEAPDADYLAAVGEGYRRARALLGGPLTVVARLTRAFTPTLGFLEEMERVVDKGTLIERLILLGDPAVMDLVFEPGSERRSPCLGVHVVDSEAETRQLIDACSSARGTDVSLLVAELTSAGA